MTGSNSSHDPLQELDQLLARIREVCAALYRRGCEDTAARILQAMNSSSPMPALPQLTKTPKPQQGKKRARRGTPRALVERALKEGATTAREILDSAKSGEERQVSYSAIRLELQRGRKEKRYTNSDGTWGLAHR
jgi:hypothetical protein